MRCFVYYYFFTH